MFVLLDTALACILAQLGESSVVDELHWDVGHKVRAAKVCNAYRTNIIFSIMLY